MSELFVSHASADKALALRVRDALLANGYASVFLDVDPERGIAPFAEWERVLYRKLRACRAVVALCTDSFVSSKWCFAEIAIARSLERAVLPVVSDCFTGKVSALPGSLAKRQVISAGDDDAALATELAEGLRALGIDPSPWELWDPRRSPYPGLVSHDESLAPVFFGREEEVQLGLQMLRGARSVGSSRFIAIVGSSGTGKSSLMRAGILPQVRIATAEPWQIVSLQPFRPGRVPVSDLASALARTFGGAWAEHRDRILAEDAIHPLIQDLLRDRQVEGARVLLALDQFEEWLGGEPDSNALLRLLRGALDTDPDIVVLVTMRSDFLGSLQSHEQLRGLQKRLLSVEPIGTAALRRAVVEPARVAGAEVEDDLVERILADALHGPGRLPLVAFTLERLWEVGVTPTDRRLELSEYEQLGGIGGAIRTRVAECVPDDTSAEELAELREKFQALVDLDQEGRFRRRRAIWEDDEPAGRLLERLLQGRLLTVHEADGQRVLEVAHEALFEEWELLQQWLHEDRELLGFRAELAAAAHVWSRDGEAAGDLWRGGRLQRASELRDTGRLALKGLGLRFLETSLAERAREAAAEEARREERVRMGAISHARGLAIQARDALATHPQRALALAVEAVEATRREGLPPCPEAESALHALVGQVSGRPHWAPSRGAINALVPSPDGTLLACAQADGSVSVWPLRKGVPAGDPVLLGAHEAAAVSAVWHGDLLFTSGQDAAVMRWHPAEPNRAPERVRGGAEIRHLAVDPRGRWLVAGAGKTLIVWPLGGGDHTVLEGHTDRVRAVAFHPGGGYLLSSDFEGGLLAWSPAEEKIKEPPTPWQEPDRNRIEAIAFDPRGRFFVTGGLEGVLLWRVSLGSEGRLEIKVETLAGMEEYVVQVAVSPSGGAIAAGSYYGRCAAWLEDDNFQTPVDLGSGLRLPKDPFEAQGVGLLTVDRRAPRIDYREVPQLREGLLPLSLRGDDAVRPVSFLPDGSIAAGDETGVLRRWAGVSQHPEQLWVPQPGLDLNKVAISARACVVLTAGERAARGRELDRRARMVDLDSGQVEVLSPFDAGVDAVAVSSDGAILVLGSERADEIVLIGRTIGTRRELPLEGGVKCVALSADKSVLAAGVGSAVHLWDLSSGAVSAPIATEATVLSVAFAPQAKHLAASLAGGIVCLWDLRGDSPKPIGQRKLGDLVSDLTWLRDGSALIASGITGWKGGALLCRLDESPERWAELDLGSAGQAGTRTAVAVSEDGTRLVAAGDGGNIARVFDLGDLEAAPRDLRGHDKHIRDVALTPDGGRIATSSEDATIRLWDLDQWEPVVISVVNGSAGRVAFRGDRLVAISEAGVHRWSLDVEAVIGLAGATASRNLTPDEWRRFLPGEAQPTFPNMATG